MMIEELYEWAKAHDALNLEIVTFDSCGDITSSIYPEIKVRWGNEVVTL